MSLTIVEKVKQFLIRLVKDEDFRTQLMSDKVEEVKKIMVDSGYNFSQEEFETAAIQILDLKESGEFHELSEEELVGAFGGLTGLIISEPIFQPMYGVVIQPPEDSYPKPDPQPSPKPRPRPLPCVCKPPIYAQPMYGVIAPTELL